MSDFKKLLGKKIQSIRKAKGLTQERLAELIDIETPSLSYWKQVNMLLLLKLYRS